MMKKTLGTIILAANSLLAQDGGFSGGMGADNRPIVPDTRVVRKPWEGCGEQYRKQFDTYYQTLTDPEHDITRVEKKHLEKDIIPYAMASTRYLNLVDLDGDGQKDLLSLSSLSRVSGCTIDDHFLEKDNRFYIERKDGSIIDVNWRGPLAESIGVLPGTTMLKVYMRDEKGNPSMKYINWKVPV